MKTGQDYDVIVIGSGAGGAATAWGLARRGAKVLILEAGPFYDPVHDYRLDKPQWEQRRFPEKIAIAGRQVFAPLQKLEPAWKELRSWNTVTGPLNPSDRRKPWIYDHVVGVGGSTLHFTGEAHRLHPDAMKMRSRYGVAADWPIDYAELESYYCDVERVIGVAGPHDEPTRPRSQPYPLPPHALSYASQAIQKACKKLHLNWTENPVAILSRPYDGRPGCNYCANCNRGCPRRDKGSTDVTFIKKALDSGNCTIRPNCQVTRLEAGKHDKITHVHFVDAKNQTSAIKAPIVVVACGAVETPRLLLASASQAAPDGVANESGLVGRNFMETLSWTATGLHPKPLGSYRGLPSDSICWDYNAPDAIPGVVGGCRVSPATAEADLVGPLGYARRVVAGWGGQHKADMRTTFGRALAVGAIGESLPNTRSYIDLDPDKSDALGKPLARIHSYLPAGELQRLAFMAEKSREILNACGVEKMLEEYGTYDFFSSTHVFGTCRMGDDPQHSVVNGFGQSHRWHNLFITDASVFPSSGGGESPSLTIEALALRSADHIADSFPGPTTPD